MTAGKTILREDHKRTRAATTAPHSGIVLFFLNNQFCLLKMECASSMTHVTLLV